VAYSLASATTQSQGSRVREKAYQGAAGLAPRNERFAEISTAIKQINQIEE
jgi:hypothetical protein